jgi:hypothetical protein
VEEGREPVSLPLGFFTISLPSTQKLLTSWMKSFGEDEKGVRETDTKKNMQGNFTFLIILYKTLKF